MAEKSELSRRRLLEICSAASGAVVSSWWTAEDALSATEPSPRQVPRRKLGKTGKSIPILLLGGGAGFDRKFDPKIAQALRHGLDYVDAARVYAGGTCEAHAAKTLTRLGKLDETWITSKSPLHDAAGFESKVSESLAELGRKSVDLYYLHALEDPSPLGDRALWKTVERLKTQGKIKHFGFSCHDGNVADLLHRAAALPLIDSVMFRYNFRTYGDKALNVAMDAAHEAGVGLIAMKTQGAEASFRDAWKKFERGGKWTKHQAVLKAVWADSRITAAVSHMDSLEKLQQNLAAAVDTAKLGLADESALERYAAATRHQACDGCAHLCSSALASPRQTGTLMRSVMYHDAYGDAAKAKRVFQAIPEAERSLAGVDWSTANRACPHGVDVAAHVQRAHELFA